MDLAPSFNSVHLSNAGFAILGWRTFIGESSDEQVVFRRQVHAKQLVGGNAPPR
jgi:hypothetical protein